MKICEKSVRLRAGFQKCSLQKIALPMRFLGSLLLTNAAADLWNHLCSLSRQLETSRSPLTAFLSNTLSSHKLEIPSATPPPPPRTSTATGKLCYNRAGPIWLPTAGWSMHGPLNGALRAFYSSWTVLPWERQPICRVHYISEVRTPLYSQIYLTRIFPDPMSKGASSSGLAVTQPRTEM